MKNEKQKIEDDHDQAKQALKEAQDKLETRAVAFKRPEDKLGEASEEKQSVEKAPEVEKEADSEKVQEIEKIKNDSET